MRGGDGVPWPAAGPDFFDFFALFSYLFSWEFGVLALGALGVQSAASHPGPGSSRPYAITPCDSLSALLTVP